MSANKDALSRINAIRSRANKENRPLTATERLEIQRLMQIEDETN